MYIVYMYMHNFYALVMLSCRVLYWLSLFYSELCSYCSSWFIGVLSVLPTHVCLQGQLACESDSPLSLSLSLSLTTIHFPLDIFFTPQDNGILQRIEQYKPSFWEPRRKSEFNPVISSDSFPVAATT